LDSVNAATGLGIVPGISSVSSPDTGVLDFVARDEGNLFGVLLRFANYTTPLTFVKGDYFPEDVNLSEGLARATFTFSDFLNPDAVVAKVTSASMAIESATPSA